MESTEIKASLNLDCIHLHCEMNTGHIDTLKYAPKVCNLGLSNAPKNAKNGPVLLKNKNPGQQGIPIDSSLAKAGPIPAWPMTSRYRIQQWRASKIGV